MKCFLLGTIFLYSVETAYVFYFAENQPPGSKVGKVDGLSPFIQNGANEDFNLSKLSGEIFSRRAFSTKLLSQSQTNEYYFNFTVSSATKDEAIEVVVCVFSFPLFSEPLYNMQLKEDTKVNSWTKIIFSNVTKLFIKYNTENFKDKFQLVTNENQELFLQLLSPLDYEEQNQFSLNISACVTKTLFCNFLSLNLSILDVNDNFPEFEQKTYHFEIYENISVGEKIGYVHSVDLDSGSNAQIKYSLHETNEFSINQSSGEIFLKTSVDAELRIFYKVLCIASDQGNPPKISSVILSFTVLDCNDNPPSIDIVFAQTDAFQILEGEVVGWKVATITMSDPDSVNQNLDPDLLINDTEYFELRKEANSFLLLTRKVIDRESTPFLFLLFTAKDSLSTLLETQKKVQINIGDINDNSPKFSQPMYNVSVRESVGVGELVVRVLATDPDLGKNAEVSYAIDFHGFLKTDLLKLDRQSGEISFKKKVDFEVVSIIEFQIYAVDHGIPQQKAYASVRITLIDVNDNHPYFSPSIMVFNISENKKVGSFIGQVHALDEDKVDSNKITYYLNSNILQVDNKTGEIKSLKVFDREEKERYELEISAFDSGGLEGKGTLVINIEDLNDCSPSFESKIFNISITENFPLFKVAFYITAHDPDEGSNAVSFYSATFQDDTFSIDSMTGGVNLNRNLKFAARMFDFQVSVQDAGGFPGVNTSRVIVNIFPPCILPPVFLKNKYTFNVTENNIIGQVIGVLNAVRPLSHSAAFIFFEIVDSNENFIIESTTGLLRTNKALDFEEKHEDFVLVKAFDSLNVSLLNFTKVQINILDQNDNHPWFVNKIETVSVPEGIPIGHIFFKCQAYDKDFGLNGLIKYSLINTSGPINVSSNDCDVFSTGPIDYELVKEYIAYIQATDQSPPYYKATLQLKIKVLDTNDNLPIFFNSHFVHIKENLPINSLIITFQALDRDSGANGELFYQIAHSKHSDIFMLSLNGSLYLRKSVDHEVNPFFILQIQVFDKGSPPQKNEMKFKVMVDDENDNPPVFEKDQYTFYLNEESPVGSVVGVVAAVDKDKGANAKLEFSILSNDFTNDTENVLGRPECIIRALRKFDSESGDTFFNVTIEVKDHGVPFMTTRVQALIFIININDHAPKFSKSTAYLACVIRETNANSKVVQVEAIDHDVNPKPLKYNLGVTENKNSEFLSIFRIDPSNGAVYTKKKIDSQMASFYETTVSVEEIGDGVNLFNYQKLVIFIVPPLNHIFFTNSCRMAAVTENSQPLQGVISDAISYNNTYTVSNYSIKEKGLPFFVLKTTGLLKLAQALSFEKAKFYQFHITAEGLWKEDKSSLFTDSIIMSIYVIPENKHVPTYPNNPERYTIIEDWPTFKPFAILQRASDNDADLGGFIIYSINSTNPPDAPVQLSPLSRELFLTQTVDYEKQDVLSLKISVTDLAINVNERLFNTFTVYISIKDVNDNSPIFKSPTSAYVQEGEAPRSMVLNIQAEDPDRGETHTAVGYSIVSGNDLGLFSLNYLTGDLSTSKSLNASLGSMYILTIEIVELRENKLLLSLKSTQNVTIYVVDVNDNAPKFSHSIYYAAIKENMMDSSFVAQLEYFDSDILEENTQSSFELLNNLDQFSISSETGIILTKRALDRETQSSFVLTVTVKNLAYPYDQDSCTVVVVIEDVNDNPPVFRGGEKVKLHILENLLPTKIHKFEVFDPDDAVNADVYFFLFPPQLHFFINKTTGELHVLHSLDREERRKYKFTVFAENTSPPNFLGYQNVTLVVEDVNDEKPEFAQKLYYIKFQETSSVNMTILHVLATDKDSSGNSVIYYELVNSSDHFIINADTGRISTTTPLDYEQEKKYLLEVHAIDIKSKMFDICHVIIEVIDMNDNYPVFMQSVYTKVIEKVTSRYVMRVQATDADLNGKQGVSYAFDPPSYHFNISASTGEIFITDQDLTPGQYHLHVRAVDDGGYKKSYAQVFVTIGNNTVIDFVNKSTIFTIDENPPNGFVLGSINAKAKSNHPIRYSILQTTNPDSAFAINEDGEIYVNKSESIDYEKYPTISLGVLASVSVNGEVFSSYLTVVIHLNDINDNDPQIIPLNKQFKYFESDSANFKPHILNYFDVKDDDHIDLNKLKVAIISGNDDGMFEIVEGTTVMTLLKPIDYEVKQVYSLLVRVYDGGSPPRFSDSHYTLIIEDQNDNPPVFQNIMPISVSEDTTPGSIIGNVKATDIDVSTYEIIYEIVNDSSLFTIDEKIGNIILKKSKSLDYEKVKFYDLNISASDGLHKTYFLLHINVIDANDHPPIFSKQLYSVKVQDTIKMGEYIIKVSAYDLDSESFGYVQYLLDPPQDAFTIEQDSGVIVTNKEFQFNDDATVMELRVVAFDSKMAPGYLKSSSVVLLEVEGKKVVYPKFQQSHYYMKVSEGASMGADVGTVTAWFTNSLHQIIKYSLTNESAGEPFAINPYTGQLKVNSQLDRETQSSYDIEVIATIVRQPEIFTKCNVSIHILDINDNNPIFKQSSYNVSALEDQEVGQVLLTVTATDADDITTENGKVRYEIHSGQDDYEWLTIDADTGVIKTKKSLDREMRPFLQISIKAADYKGSGQSGFARLNVTVLDVNDNPPEFKVDVPTFHGIQILENQPAGTIVFKANAFDLDEGLNGLISYSIMNTGHEMFYMQDSSSGWVYTKAPLNYESVSLYNLTVVATDHGAIPLVSSFEYQIRVQDVNEYAPLFTKSRFVFNIPANLEVGEIIGKVESIDEDGGDANITQYTILSGFLDKFSLDSKSGEITLLKDLRYHVRGNPSDVVEYLLKLRADNVPSDSLFSLADVLIIANYTCIGCESIAEVIPIAKKSMASSSILIVFASVLVLVFLTFLVICIVYCRRKSYRCNRKPLFCNSNKVNLPNSSVECELLHSYSKHSTFDTVNNRLFSDYPEKSSGTQLSSAIGLLKKSSETSASVTDKASTFSFGIYHEQEAELHPFLNGISKLNLKSVDDKKAFRFSVSKRSPKNSISVDSSEVSLFKEITVRKPLYNFKPRQAGSGNSVVRNSHESLKDFTEEGGGEAAGRIDVRNLLYAKLAEVEDQHEESTDGVKPFKDEGIMSRGGSLSTIIASDEELSAYEYEWPSHMLKPRQVFQDADYTVKLDCDIVPLKNFSVATDFSSQQRHRSSGSPFTLSTTSGNTNVSADKARIWRSGSVCSQLSRITLSDINLTDDEDVRV